MKEFFIKTKEKGCFPFDEWITSLEMRAFGWADRKYRTEWYDEYFIDIDWDKSTAKVSQKFNVYRVFKRVEPYSDNFLFKLLEVFMAIQSWIRRKLILLFWLVDVILFGIGILYLVGGSGMNEYIALGIAVAVFVYMPSLIIAVLGFLTRKIFKLDKKLKDSLEENGFMREQNF